MVSKSQSKASTAKRSENGDTPLYKQIYDHFRKQIVSGDLEKHTHLPSEQDITEKFGVSRITVRRALNELAAAGLVTRQRGRGTIVTFNAAAPTIRASFDQLIAGLTRMGVETEVRLISCVTVKPKRELRDQMELSKGENLQRIVRLRLLDGEPFSYLITHIPKHVSQGYNDEELASQSLIGLLDRAGHRPQSAMQSITAVAAEGEAAKLLEIAEGVPLLRIHRIMRDKEDRIVQDISAHYRADRFQYQMTLARQSDASWAAED